MTTRTATTIGFAAILLWSLLALFTAASGTVPPFQLAAMTFLVGGLLGAATWLARPQGLAGAPPAGRVWALGLGGLFGYHALYFAALRSRRRPRRASSTISGRCSSCCSPRSCRASACGPRHVVGAASGLCRRGRAHRRARIARRAGRVLAGLSCAPSPAPSSGLRYSVLSRRFGGVPTDAVAGFCLADLRARALPATSPSRRRSGRRPRRNGLRSSRSASGRSGRHSTSGTSA